MITYMFINIFLHWKAVFKRPGNIILILLTCFIYLNFNTVGISAECAVVGRSPDKKQFTNVAKSIKKCDYKKRFMTVLWANTIKGYTILEFIVNS